MKSVNEVILLGNMTRDPEVRQTASGQTICAFGLATNHDYADGQGNKQSEAEFHNIIAWAKLGEFIGKYFRKGDAVYVTGRLKTRSWNDEATGAKKFRTEIIARDAIQVRRAGGRPAGGDDGEMDYENTTDEVPAVNANDLPSIDEENS